MKVELTDFDAARYLDSEEAIADYLAVCAEDPNPAVMIRALAAVARARGMTQLAKDTGLGRESLYKALTPGKKPQYATITAIMRGLGVRLDVRPVETPKPKRRARKATAPA